MDNKESKKELPNIYTLLDKVNFDKRITDFNERQRAFEVIRDIYDLLLEDLEQVNMLPKDFSGIEKQIKLNKEDFFKGREFIFHSLNDKVNPKILKVSIANRRYIKFYGTVLHYDLKNGCITSRLDKGRSKGYIIPKNDQ